MIHNRLPSGCLVARMRRINQGNNIFARKIFGKGAGDAALLLRCRIIGALAFVVETQNWRSAESLRACDDPAMPAAESDARYFAHRPGCIDQLRFSWSVPRKIQQVAAIGASVYASAAFRAHHVKKISSVRCIGI